MKKTNIVRNTLAIIAGAALAISVSASFASAQTGGLLRGLRTQLQTNRQSYRIEASSTRTQIEDARAQFNANVRASSTALRADIQAELAAATSSVARRAILKAAQDEIQGFRGDVKDARQNMQQGFQEERAQLKSERIRIASEHLNLMLARFTIALNTFTQIDARIDARIGKLQDMGIDVSAAVSASAAVKTSITNAKATIANASTTISAAINADTPAQHMKDVQAALKSAQDAVKAVHDTLQNAVNALKTISKPNPHSSDSAVEHATSTKDN